MTDRDNRFVDAEIMRLWGHYLDGVGLVARALDTARAGHLYRKGQPVTLTMNEVEDLLIRSEAKCEVSGIPFSGLAIPGCHKRPFIPSIDRIQAKGPYSFENCRLVCWAVNLALGEWGEEPFWTMVEYAGIKGRRPSTQTPSMG